jgi:hypothetical protein
LVDGWCWFVLTETYYWMIVGGWFVLRENYCWLVADKPSEQGYVCLPEAHKQSNFQPTKFHLNGVFYFPTNSLNNY